MPASLHADRTTDAWRSSQQKMAVRRGRDCSQWISLQVIVSPWLIGQRVSEKAEVAAVTPVCDSFAKAAAPFF